MENENEFEDAFNGKSEDAAPAAEQGADSAPAAESAPAPAAAPDSSSEPGYGIDPRLHDQSEMYKAWIESETAAANAAQKPAEAEKSGQPEFKSFGEAFKWHRKNGDKVFEWKGKSFTTKLATEAAPKRAKAKPAAAKPAARNAADSVVRVKSDAAQVIPPAKDPVKVPEQDAAVFFDEAVRGKPAPIPQKPAEKPAPAEPAKHVPPFAQETKLARPYTGKDKGWQGGSN